MRRVLPGSEAAAGPRPCGCFLPLPWASPSSAGGGEARLGRAVRGGEQGGERGREGLRHSVGHRPAHREPITQAQRLLAPAPSPCDLKTHRNDSRRSPASLSCSALFLLWIAPACPETWPGWLGWGGGLWVTWGWLPLGACACSASPV